MHIKTLQQSFAAAIYHDDTAPLAAAIRPAYVTNEQRIQIYRDNVFITLHDTLKNRYAAVCKLVDERFFHYAATEYLKENQPTSGNLDNFGKSFIPFIKNFPAAESLPYLADVAALEWAQHVAYFAADHAPIDAAALAAVTPEQLEHLTFALHPSAQLLSSPHPVEKIMQMTDENYKGDYHLDKTVKDTYLLIARPAYRVETSSLTASEYAFLTALHQGKSLYEAFENAEAEDDAFEVATAIQKFVGNGVFCGFKIKSM